MTILDRSLSLTYGGNMLTAYADDRAFAVMGCFRLRLPSTITEIAPKTSGRLAGCIFELGSIYAAEASTAAAAALAVTVAERAIISDKESERTEERGGV